MSRSKARNENDRRSNISGYSRCRRRSYRSRTCTSRIYTKHQMLRLYNKQGASCDVCIRVLRIRGNELVLVIVRSFLWRKSLIIIAPNTGLVKWRQATMKPQRCAVISGGYRPISQLMNVDHGDSQVEVVHSPMNVTSREKKSDGIVFPYWDARGNLGLNC